MSHRQPELRPAAPAATALAATAVVAAALVALLGLLPAVASAAEAGPIIKIDASSWQGLSRGLAQIEPGKAVDEKAYERLWQTSGYATLSKVITPRELNPAILLNVSRYVFAEDRENSPKRNDLVDNFFYLQRNLARANETATAMSAPRLAAEIGQRLGPYVRPGELPDTITVHLLAMGPEIKYAPGQLWLDMGMALAAGPDQLPDLLAAVIYREIGLKVAPEPRRAPLGPAAVRATFARLQQEGIAAWIERYPDVQLDVTHPALGRKPEVRLAPFVRAGEALASLQTNLKPLLKSKEDLESGSLMLDDLLRGSGGYPVVGYAMAALVADTYGEQRLQELSRDPEGFLSAYQEAARKRPGDLVPHESDPVQHGMNNLPHFDSKDFGQLMKILKQAT